MTLELDKYISELLYDYDCVIVPQLGGFVTNYKPALLKGGIAYPASKELRFNKNLSKNDGLLSQSIADKNGVSIQEADKLLHEVVESHLSKLRFDKRVELKKVGVLYIDQNEQLRFTPDETVNYLRGSFGFEAFELPQEMAPIVPTVMENEVEPEEETKVIPIAASEPRSGIKWVAAATLLPFIAMSVYLGLKTDFKSPTELNAADLFPLKSVEKRYSVREATGIEAREMRNNEGFPENTEVFRFNFETNEVDSLGVWVNLSHAESVTKSTETSVSNGLYHIIGGCFENKENADAFVSRLRMRGYNAGVLDHNKGLYRVKIESFDSYNLALTTLKDTRESGTFPNAWMLKKKV
jgi:hypothetical protein